MNNLITDYKLIQAYFLKSRLNLKMQLKVGPTSTQRTLMYLDFCRSAYC